MRSTLMGFCLGHESVSSPSKSSCFIFLVWAVVRWTVTQASNGPEPTKQATTTFRFLSPQHPVSRYFSFSSRSLSLPALVSPIFANSLPNLLSLSFVSVFTPYLRLAKVNKQVNRMLRTRGKVQCAWRVTCCFDTKWLNTRYPVTALFPF